MPAADDDPGLLRPEEAGLFTDSYELAMAASYHAQGMDERAVFELWVRSLPRERHWLLAAGLNPVLSLLDRLTFAEHELAWLSERGYDEGFLARLDSWRFEGDIDAVPEGTVVFAGEPILRVTAPRIEAQMLETLLLNQILTATMLATKAARVVLAAGGGEPGSGGAVVDFSARRTHGIDAGIKAARSAAVAGCAGTSNVAAALRYGMPAIGTMAHSYVQSFEAEIDAFRAFMRDFPENAVMLVDTYDTPRGVRRAIAAAEQEGAKLAAVRLDSGDLPELARDARATLDAAGFASTRIVASGDLDEWRIAELVEAGAPIDQWGVGTAMGTSSDAPSLGGVYKLVADERDGEWRPVIKAAADKATHPLPKQVLRRVREGEMAGDLIAIDGEEAEGTPLLVPAVRSGERVHREGLEEIRARSERELGLLPERLRLPARGTEPEPYPVERSAALEAAFREALARERGEDQG